MEENILFIGIHITHICNVHGVGPSDYDSFVVRVKRLSSSYYQSLSDKGKQHLDLQLCFSFLCDVKMS